MNKMQKYKQKMSAQAGPGKSGHIVKYAANAYQSKKGKGDVLKEGKYEPFAYIKLNPNMMSSKHRE
jgi:hypothetical protein